jgi:hypothetical protein
MIRRALSATFQIAACCGKVVRSIVERLVSVAPMLFLKPFSGGLTHPANAYLFFLALVMLFN